MCCKERQVSRTFVTQGDDTTRCPHCKAHVDAGSIDVGQYDCSDAWATCETCGKDIYLEAVLLLVTAKDETSGSQRAARVRRVAEQL